MRSIAPASAAALAVLILVASCTERIPLPAERVARARDVPLVFIHGLMGGALVGEKGDRKWLSGAQALALSTPPLALPRRWNRESQDADSLRPDGPVQAVEIAPGLGQEIYGPFLGYAVRIPRRAFYAFSYDWRRSNVESCGLFEQYLARIAARHQSKRIQVIAHSMGGLITLCVWNRRPDLIDRVVFAGVPFRGGIGYLDNMFLGTPIGINRKLLSPEVLFSFPSVYSFYPAGRRGESVDLLEDERGSLLHLDFYDAETWRANGFGPYAPENAKWAAARGTAAYRTQTEFLARVLAEGHHFRQLLEPPATRALPPALVIMSKVHPTLARARRIPPSDNHAVPRWDFEVAARAPGDDSVLYHHALPPPPIRYRVFLTEYKHSYLLNDPAVQAELERFLR